MTTNNQETKLDMTKQIIKDNIQSFGMIFALVFLWIIFNFATGGTFLTIRNISNLLRQTTVVGILAIGMVMVIISANFDLSVGSVAGLSGAIVAYASTELGLSPQLSVLLALAVGLLLGVWSGYWIAYQKVPAFIVTLGGMMIYRGFVIFITGGSTIMLRAPELLTLGQDYLSPLISYVILVAFLLIYGYAKYSQRKYKLKFNFEVPSLKFEVAKFAIISVLLFIFVYLMNSYAGIPMSVLLLLLLILFFTFVLRRTRYGRHIFAVGGNDNAASLSGINTPFMIMKVFIVLKLLAALAGIVMTSRLGAATPDAGEMFELDAIASCVIGGASLYGGSGTILGAVIGALVMATLDNGMSLLGASPAWQYFIKGLVLILAVWFDIKNRK